MKYDPAGSTPPFHASCSFPHFINMSSYSRWVRDEEVLYFHPYFTEHTPLISAIRTKTGCLMAWSGLDTMQIIASIRSSIPPPMLSMSVRQESHTGLLSPQVPPTFQSIAAVPAEGEPVCTLAFPIS